MEMTSIAPQQEPKKIFGAVLDIQDDVLGKQFDSYTLEAIAELKISRFLDQVSTNCLTDLYYLVMTKAEKPLIKQIHLRNSNNHVQSARNLWVNRNNFRKKINFINCKRFLFDA